LFSLLDVPKIGLCSTSLQTSARAILTMCGRPIEFALSFDGKRRFRHADGLAAAITADHLVRHLEMAGGYVVVKRPPRKAHSTPR
jgi:hypothetical protein